MRQSLAILFASALFAATALAAPAENHWGEGPKPGDGSAFGEALQLIVDAQYRPAIPKLQALAAAEPGNADVWNMLGYAQRKGGDLAGAAAAYARALRLDRFHRGALEYQGELFLAQDDLPAAEANLRRLQAICAGPCEEATDLWSAIESHKAGAGPSTGSKW